MWSKCQGRKKHFHKADSAMKKITYDVIQKGKRVKKQIFKFLFFGLIKPKKSVKVFKNVLGYFLLFE